MYLRGLYVPQNDTEAKRYLEQVRVQSSDRFVVLLPLGL